MIFQKRCKKKIYPYCIGKKCPFYEKCYIKKFLSSLLLWTFLDKD